MKRRTRIETWLVLSVLSGMASPASANTVIVTLHTLHVDLQTNMAHVYLDGMPTFNGGGCSGGQTAAAKNPKPSEEDILAALEYLEFEAPSGKVKMRIWRQE